MRCYLRWLHVEKGDNSPVAANHSFRDSYKRLSITVLRHFRRTDISIPAPAPPFPTSLAPDSLHRLLDRPPRLPTTLGFAAQGSAMFAGVATPVLRRNCLHHANHQRSGGSKSGCLQTCLCLRQYGSDHSAASVAFRQTQ